MSRSGHRSTLSQSLATRFAVAGGGYSDDWRVVCSCQHHRKGRFTAAVRRLIRRRVALLTMAATVSFAAVGIPTRATMLADSPRTFAAGMLRDMNVVRTRPVFSDRFRARYIDSDFFARHQGIISERVREEFFRTEIPYGSVIYDEAKRNGLAPELVAAIVKTESDFRPALRSHKNALGLMQVVPTTGRLMGVHDLLDPAQNVRAGSRYLRYLHRRFGGDQKMILAAYNAGEGNIARFGGIPPFRETQEYLQRVARNRQRYHDLIASRIALRQASSMLIPGSSALFADLEGFGGASAQN